MIAVAVPFHDGDRVAFLDADLRQPAGQTADAFAELPIGAAPEIAINDLLLGRARQRLVQQVFDEQRIDISRRRRLNQLDGHFTLLPLRDFSAFWGLNYQIGNPGQLPSTRLHESRRRKCETEWDESLTRAPCAPRFCHITRPGIFPGYSELYTLWCGICFDGGQDLPCLPFVNAGVDGP